MYEATPYDRLYNFAILYKIYRVYCTCMFVVQQMAKFYSLVPGSRAWSMGDPVLTYWALGPGPPVTSHLEG